MARAVPFLPGLRRGKRASFVPPPPPPPRRPGAGVARRRCPAERLGSPAARRPPGGKRAAASGGGEARAALQNPVKVLALWALPGAKAGGRLACGARGRGGPSALRHERQELERIDKTGLCSRKSFFRRGQLSHSPYRRKCPFFIKVIRCSSSAMLFGGVSTGDEQPGKMC